MRLIDADALIADLEHDVAMDQDSLDNEELTETNRENIQFDKDCKQNAIDLLQHAPTIEEREKGHWLFKNQHTRTFHSEMRVTCNLCGYPKSRVDGEVLDFCPSCGADMRGNNDA